MDQDATVLGGKHLEIHLFLGVQTKKLDVDVVEKLLEHAQAVQMIRSPKQGKNALDFVLAYHLGQAVLTDPKGYFHIVSKDAGFDALVDMLKSRNAKVKRHEDWTTLNFQSTPKPSPAPVAGVGKRSVKIDSPGSKAIGVVALSAVALKFRENLTKSPKNRPK